MHCERLLFTRTHFNCILTSVYVRCHMAWIRDKVGYWRHIIGRLSRQLAERRANSLEVMSSEMKLVTGGWVRAAVLPRTGLLGR